MVSPDPTQRVNAGAPPGVYDPYKALIDALPLSQDIVALLKPAFDLKGSPLQLEQTGLTDYAKKPLPHYQVDTERGKVFLIHLAESVAADSYAQNWFMMLAFPFMNAKPCALFIFSEVDSFGFDTEPIIDTWQGGLPNLKVRFLALPLIQQLKLETSEEKRISLVRSLLYLDELLVANQANLDTQIEDAYQQARLDLLDNLKGLPERLTDGDKKCIIDLLTEYALTSPLSDPKRYLFDFIRKLGLESKEMALIFSILGGNASNDSEAIVLWVEEKTYPNGPVQGYKRVLGYLLSLLADEGGAKKIALIIFKYRLVASTSTLQDLVQKYP